MAQAETEGVAKSPRAQSIIKQGRTIAWGVAGACQALFDAVSAYPPGLPPSSSSRLAVHFTEFPAKKDNPDYHEAVTTVSFNSFFLIF